MTRKRTIGKRSFRAFTGFTGDEETVLDYWNSFWSGNLEASYNPLAYMPYFKDLVSIAQGYDVTRMDMEAIEKVWSAFTNMRSACRARAGTASPERRPTCWRRWRGCSASPSPTSSGTCRRWLLRRPSKRTTT